MLQLNKVHPLKIGSEILNSEIQHFMQNNIYFFLSNTNPLEFGGQQGHSGTSKSCRIRWLNTSIFQETKSKYIKLASETEYIK